MSDQHKHTVDVLNCFTVNTNCFTVSAWMGIDKMCLLPAGVIITITPICLCVSLVNN